MRIPNGPYQLCVNEMQKLWKLIGISLLLAGCVDSKVNEDSIPTAKAEPRESTSGTGGVAGKTTGEAKSRRIGDFKFDIPAAWEEKALANNMILGEYSVPGAAGAGRLTFSTAGGGTAANLDRWKGQFRKGDQDPEPQESSIKVAGKEASLIEVHGTFTDMFGGGSPKSSWQLLGVAIPISPEHNFFVKLTGPKETLSAVRDEFLKMAQSARAD